MPSDYETDRAYIPQLPGLHGASGQGDSSDDSSN